MAQINRFLHPQQLLNNFHENTISSILQTPTETNRKTTHGLHKPDPNASLTLPFNQSSKQESQDRETSNRAPISEQPQQYTGSGMQEQQVSSEQEVEAQAVQETTAMNEAHDGRKRRRVSTNYGANAGKKYVHWTDDQVERLSAYLAQHVQFATSPSMEACEAIKVKVFPSEEEVTPKRLFGKICNMRAAYRRNEGEYESLEI